jgi:DNA-binding CsgD family transcriptional regulator
VAEAIELARATMAASYDQPLCADTNAAVSIPLTALATATRAGVDASVVATEFAHRFTEWVGNERWGAGPPAEVGTMQRHVDAEVAVANGCGDPDVWAALAEEWSTYSRAPWVAYARTREAELRLAVGDRPGAGDAARVAHRMADDIGWQWLTEILGDLARRARLDIGIDSGPPPVDNDFGLTERELGVLALVAAGRTNRQIAEELFISTKTASAHVSKLLTKLEVTNRGEAGAAARRLGLD